MADILSQGFVRFDCFPSFSLAFLFDKQAQLRQTKTNMTKEGWINLIKNTYNNKKQLDLLADLLLEVEAAKQLLHDNGYGCTGMSLLETIKREIIINQKEEI